MNLGQDLFVMFNVSTHLKFINLKLPLRCIPDPMFEKRPVGYKRYGNIRLNDSVFAALVACSVSFL